MKSLRDEIRQWRMKRCFVGACTARPSFYNSYSFAEAGRPRGRCSQATRYYGGFGWLASVTPSFPACRWRKTIHRIVFLAPLFSSNFNTCTSGANFTYARGHKLHLRLNPQTSLFWLCQNNFTASARMRLQCGRAMVVPRRQLGITVASAGSPA